MPTWIDGALVPEPEQNQTPEAEDSDSDLLFPTLEKDNTAKPVVN